MIDYVTIITKILIVPKDNMKQRMFLNNEILMATKIIDHFYYKQQQNYCDFTRS